MGDVRGAKYPAAHISPQPAKEGLHKSLPVIANEAKQSKNLCKSKAYRSPRRYAPRDDKVSKIFPRLQGGRESSPY